MIKQKQDSSKRIDELTEIIRLQKKIIDNNNRILQSKRHRYADRLADLFNKVLPKGGVVRRLALGFSPVKKFLKKAIQAPGKLWKDYKMDRLEDRIEDWLDDHDALYLYIALPWDSPVQQRAHHMTKELAKLDGNRIVYIDLSRKEASFVFDGDVLVIGGGEAVLNSVFEASEDIKFKFCIVPSPQPIPFVTLESIVRNGFRVVYEHIDDFCEEVFGDMRHQYEVFDRLEELNPILLVGSAKVLVNQLKSRFKDRPVEYIPNGVDIEQFNYNNYSFVVSDVPDDMLPLVKSGKKIVGYYGSISQWLDYELLDFVIGQYPEIEFCFIGVDNGGGVDRLLNIKRNNLHFLGPKNYIDLPRYSYWFDCALMPFKDGEVAKSTSPVKLFEYMAMGLPTVGTKDLKECEGYDGVLLASDDKSFSKNIGVAIRMKKDSRARQKLLKYSKNSAWSIWAKKLDSQLKKMSTKV